jgi:hypothetical protein
MSEQQPLPKAQESVKNFTDTQALAAEFDKLSRERDPKQRELVIAPHHERPESFKWFVAGVMYERTRVKPDAQPR